jgi:hypothetical protein
MNRTGDQTCFLFSCCDRDSVSNFAQADLKAIWVNTFLPSVHNPLGKRTDERICPPFVRGLFADASGLNQQILMGAYQALRLWKI